MPQPTPSIKNIQPKRASRSRRASVSTIAETHHEKTLTSTKVCHENARGGLNCFQICSRISFTKQGGQNARVSSNGCCFHQMDAAFINGCCFQQCQKIYETRIRLHTTAPDHRKNRTQLVCAHRASVTFKILQRFSGRSIEG